MTYRIILLVKFVGVLLFAGGMIGSFIATTPVDRKRAVHSIASPGLLITWIAGYLLTTQLGIPLTELWILGGILLSLLSQIALSHSVAREPRHKAAVAVSLISLLLVLLLMVFRPTWSNPPWVTARIKHGPHRSWATQHTQRPKGSHFHGPTPMTPKPPIQAVTV